MKVIAAMAGIAVAAAACSPAPRPDANGDGRIVLDELRDYYQHSYLRTHDRNGDRTVTQAEIGDEAGVGEFHTLDQNGDGALDAREIEVRSSLYAVSMLSECDAPPQDGAFTGAETECVEGQLRAQR